MKKILGVLALAAASFNANAGSITITNNLLTNIPPGTLNIRTFPGGPFVTTIPIPMVIAGTTRYFASIDDAYIFSYGTPPATSLNSFFPEAITTGPIVTCPLVMSVFDSPKYFHGCVSSGAPLGYYVNYTYTTPNLDITITVNAI